MCKVFFALLTFFQIFAIFQISIQNAQCGEGYNRSRRQKSDEEMAEMESRKKFGRRKSFNPKDYTVNGDYDADMAAAIANSEKTYAEEQARSQ